MGTNFQCIFLKFDNLHIVCSCPIVKIVILIYQHFVIQIHEIYI